jgi:hypothetical protein
VKTNLVAATAFALPLCQSGTHASHSKESEEYGESFSSKDKNALQQQQKIEPDPSGTK